MKKKLSAGLLVCLMVAVAVAGAPARSAQAAFSYYFNFQQDTKPFVAQATQNMAASLSRVSSDSPCEPTLQNYSARLLSQTPITVPPGAKQATWMVAALPGAQGDADSVTISWSAKVDPGKDGKGACKNCLATAYAGTAPPDRAENFTTPVQTGYMSAGWANYNFSTVVTSGVSNHIYVALGWNGTGSAIVVDCVTVTIIPIVR